MNTAVLKNCPKLLRDFLFYMETIRGRSVKTVEAYYTDLHTFFCFMKTYKGFCDSNLSTKDMDISDMCDAMKTAMTEITIDGLTGKQITWGEDGEPSKQPTVVVVEGGAYKVLQAE